jgi:transcriptional regulator with XRE-family HTH domain
MANMKIEGAGAVIRKYREQHNISLRELALRLGWDRGRLSRYENNDLALSLDALSQIATALGERPEVVVFECLRALHRNLDNSPLGKIVGSIVAGLDDSP